MHSKAKNYKVKKILITGANGFIGKNLVNLSDLRKYKKICLSTKNINSYKNTKFVKINLFDKPQVEKLIKKERPEILVHLAWETEPKKYLNSKKNLKWLHSSLSLFYFFCKYGGQKAILIGSGLELNFNSKNLKEKMQLVSDQKNLNFYNITKILFHIKAKKIANYFNKKIIWARVFWLYGPNESFKRLIPTIIKKLNNNKNIFIQDPNKIVNILHVYDVSKVISKLIRLNKNMVVHIADKKNYSIKNLINKTLQYYKNNNSKVVFNNKKNLKTNRYKININYLNNINFKYKYSIDEGLLEMINYFKNEKSKYKNK